MGRTNKQLFHIISFNVLVGISKYQHFHGSTQGWHLISRVILYCRVIYLHVENVDLSRMSRISNNIGKIVSQRKLCVRWDFHNRTLTVIEVKMKAVSLEFILIPISNV